MEYSHRQLWCFWHGTQEVLDCLPNLLNVHWCQVTSKGVQPEFFCLEIFVVMVDILLWVFLDLKCMSKSVLNWHFFCIEFNTNTLALKKLDYSIFAFGKILIFVSFRGRYFTCTGPYQACPIERGGWLCCWSSCPIWWDGTGWTSRVMVAKWQNL